MCSSLLFIIPMKQGLKLLKIKLNKINITLQNSQRNLKYSSPYFLWRCAFEVSM